MNLYTQLYKDTRLSVWGMSKERLLDRERSWFSSTLRSALDKVKKVLDAFNDESLREDATFNAVAQCETIEEIFANLGGAGFQERCFRKGVYGTFLRYRVGDL